MVRYCGGIMKFLNNKIFISFLIIIITMLIFPLLIVNFTKSLNGVFWFLLLLFAINPIISFSLGVLSGIEIRKLWFIPLMLFILFPIFYWVVLRDVVLELFVYSSGYLMIGVGAMLVTFYLKERTIK